jgi:hypothetical protein
MSGSKNLSSALDAPKNFVIREVPEGGTESQARALVAAPGLTQAPLLGPLADFVGNWTGRGFNTIFRPNSTTTPTPFPGVPDGPADNVLELNITEESLSFSTSLGSIPNRGSASQADAFLNGVPYLQTISDVTKGPAVGIHFEPGLWLSVPPTATPKEGATLARMASIPHGATINAQGTFNRALGRPSIPKVDITPTDPQNGQPVPKGTFPSQTAANSNTRRIPQNLGPFIAAGTITQAMLDDPNVVLCEQIAGQTIVETTTIIISTIPALPLFGGGPTNIAFLLGLPVPPPSAQGPNAQTVLMKATFWIETVKYEIDVPQIDVGAVPLVLSPNPTNPSTPLVPSFVIELPYGQSCSAKTITMSATQIQYSQEVILNFAGLSWPHVSVATLVPAAPIPIPLNLVL